MGVLNLGDVGVAAGVKRRRRHDQDGRIDEKRKAEGDRGVEKRKAYRLALAFRRFLVLSRLHDGRVQIQVVRHHGGPENADRDVEHLRVGEDLRGRDESPRHGAHVRLRDEQFEQEAPAHDRDERDHERLEHAEALVLQVQHDQHVDGGDRDAHGERDPKEQIEGDRGADHLGEVAGGDGDFAQHPEAKGDGRRIVIATGLREITTGHDTKLGGESLQEHRHQVRQQDHRQQGVAEARPTGEIGRPIARVHIPDGDQVTRSGERHHFPEPGGAVHIDGAVHFGQRRRQPRPTPAGLLGGRRARAGVVVRRRGRVSICSSHIRNLGEPNFFTRRRPPTPRAVTSRQRCHRDAGRPRRSACRLCAQKWRGRRRS